MASELGATERELYKVRTEKRDKLTKMGANPYPSEAKKSFLAKRIEEICPELIAAGEEIFYAGRIMAIRGHGKLCFADVVDESGKLQVILKEDLLKDNFKMVELLDLGDFVEIRGKLFITNSGETTLAAEELKILSKALRPLPEKRAGLTDEELRFRKRYLDLLTNPELRELFQKKAKFWQETRNFLVEKGFLEVETPALETTPGGADANPFITHHDALDIDVYLRISMGELWQKRLLVGGFEKTFEIGRQFRNEGISREHLQDYSQMEFYWAYANYNDSMKLTEELYKKIALAAFGTTKFKIGDFDIDLAKPWETIDYTGTIKEKLNIDVLSATDEEILNKIKELKLEHKKSDTRGRMIDSLFKSIRGQIAGPAFVINHPVEVSPLAKRLESNPKLTERFQVMLGGTENGNGYTELNDPQDQKERFQEQAKMREGGDEEAQMHDEDFVEALEYGMPPATGFGFSERLFSTLAGKPIRECVLFPLVKPEKQIETGPAKETKEVAIVINKASKLNNWQQMNAIAHLSASLAGRENGKLFLQDKIKTKDGSEIILNIQHAIMIRQAETNADLFKLAADCQDHEIEVFQFTREMLETTNDKKIVEITASKGMSDIEYLGLAIFGPKKIVDDLSNKFELVK